METKEITQEKLFQSFCAPGIFREYTEAPFEQNGYVYATNGHIIIRTPKDLYCSQAATLEKPISSFVFDGANKSIAIDFNVSEIEALKTEPEYRVLKKSQECGTCEGFGEVTWEFEHHEREDDCPVCYGSGIAEAEHKELTGNTTFGTAYVTIYDTPLDVKLFYKLVQLNEPIALIKYTSKTQAIVFKAGQYDVGIMPVSSTGDYPVIKIL
ncbi:hypothetical protein FVR03_01150 [Pontibacter qinzhouensis]|uniref:Uncharacterized protein n=1 Tax=Pontibacter qinzhouensis TaxID=2603253 RepID=A0A5C8KD61_9BACT|nr:hypothetical protein [Pontibacter qinzhouensis]TXK52350.1 hypothetical protein FVR03_01150 [Pontibacter qinzhouensis]